MVKICRFFFLSGCFEGFVPIFFGSIVAQHFVRFENKLPFTELTVGKNNWNGEMPKGRHKTIQNCNRQGWRWRWGQNFHPQPCVYHISVAVKYHWFRRIVRVTASIILWMTVIETNMQSSSRHFFNFKNNFSIRQMANFIKNCFAASDAFPLR